MTGKSFTAPNFPAIQIPKNSGLIQRACECGGKAGTSGACQDCYSAELTGLQPKLTVNQPGNRFEQEADRMAEAIVNGTAPGGGVSLVPVGDSAGGGKASKPAPVAQHLSGATRDLQSANSNTRFQRQPLEEEEEALMAKPLPGADAAAAGGAPTHSFSTSSLPPAAQDRAEGGLAAAPSTLIPGAGRPLETSTRSFMEPRFGHDFSQVRVHTGPKAEQAAASVQARAFTLGRDIIFGAREYDTGSTAGRRLLAHELTHVVQQGRGSTKRIQREPTIDASCDERKAEIEPAIEEAGELAASAKRIMENDFPKLHERDAITANFGSPTSDQKDTIIDRYQHIITNLDSKDIECKSECPKKNRTLLCAQGEISGNKIIICPRFGSEGCIPGPTILHEAAHNAGASDDIDKGASYPPTNAENNAYSYEYFILDVIKGPAPIDLGGKPEAPIFEIGE